MIYVDNISVLTWDRSEFVVMYNFTEKIKEHPT